MKRILHSSSLFAFLITAFLCGPGYLFAANKPITPANLQKKNTGFIENKGQIVDLKNNPNPAVLYLLNTSGFNVQLRVSGWSYDLFQLTSPPVPLVKERGVYNDKSSLLLQEKGLRDEVPSAKSFLFHRIDITLVGANPGCQLIPSGPLPDYFNYFTAAAPPEGIQNIRQYCKITYKNIYPDIDLEFFTNEEHGYKYNFVIHPGGNIKDIRLKIEGPTNITFRKEVLKFSTSLGDLEELIPESYCIVNNSRVAVHARFKKMDQDLYGFSFNRTLPEKSMLVIDPTAIRLWGTYYGGDSTDMFGECTVDKAGNVFLCGSTYSINNIASAGSFQGTLAGLQDCFLVKFDAAGQRRWGTYFGGTSMEIVADGLPIVTDKSGNIYFTGNTSSTSGIATPGSHQPVYGGGFQNCFLEKFNSAGGRVWGTYYGGAMHDWSGGLAIDKNGNVFLTGYTHSDTGIASPGSYQPNIFDAVYTDVFLAKFDTNGVRQWGTYYGGENDDMASSCAADDAGNVYIGAYTTSLTNVASPGAYQPTYGGGGEDALIVKFNGSGQRLWATYYGGENDDDVFGCAADSAGNFCIVGSTNSSTGIASPGCYQPTYKGGYDVLIAKFDSQGQRLWATYFGGTTYDIGNGCVFGWHDDLFVAGLTKSGNFISTPGAYQTTLGGNVDGYLVKFNNAGERLWATYYGGTGVDNFYSCTYIKDDTIYVGGDAASHNNISSMGSWQQAYGGGENDCMLVKFLDCCPIIKAGPIAGPVSVCKLSTGLTYSIPLLDHSINYIWTIPPGFTITNGAGSASITVDVSNGASSGLIVVNGFNKCGDPGDTVSLFVTVGQDPVPVISGPNNTCAGTGKVYTTAPGKTNYQWSITPGGVITSGGTTLDNTVTVTWNVVGAQHVFLVYTDINGCIAPTPTDYLVQVNPSPAVSITINTAAINVCSGTLVTFTSIPANEGGNPAYQWQVNGINSGINSSSFSYIPLNNDVVRCILTSSITGCIMYNPDTSNEVIMIVSPNLPVGITVTALPPSPVCSGTTVTFTAHPVNEGNTPTYQWKVNGFPVGTSHLTYSYIPADGDLVTCTLNSSETCTTNNPTTSTQYLVTVSPLLPVSVTVSPTANPFCAGGSVTFTATPHHGGLAPSYQWKVNGVIAGTNSDTFTYNPVNNDQVICILTSSEQCTSGNPASSITITMVENNNLPAGVSIGASNNPFCPGTSVTFTATPSNGGAPVYQWKVNGANVGTNSNTYTYNPVNNDSVRCIMTSNLACVTGNPASSNKIIMSGTLAPIVTFTSCFDTITTINARPIKLKGGIPLGGTYSGLGVNSLTGIYTPSLAGVGTHIITYTYTNSLMCTALAHTHIINFPLSIVNCGSPITDIRDNKIYQTVQIGTQCWLATNLNFGTTIASTQDQRDNCVSEKYCYNDNPLNCTIHGGLYQWDEVMRFDETPAGQGFCPPGWHIPTENDWNTLFANWTNNGFAGSPLKYSGYSGFNALLSGARNINRSWDFQGFATFFWSSTARSTDKAWAHGLNEEDPSVSIYPSSRVNAFSVRCLKD